MKALTREFTPVPEESPKSRLVLAEVRRRAVARAGALMIPAFFIGLLWSGQASRGATVAAFPGRLVGSSTQGEIPIRAASTMPFFKEGDSVTLLIPDIGLEAAIGYAPLVGRRLDSSQLADGPVLISTEAGACLSPIGLPGVSLILGHRQRGVTPRVFARLDRLAPGDRIVAFGPALTLCYSVYRIEEVAPQKLWDRIDRAGRESLRKGESTMILVTCAPYGYNWRRLLVFARSSHPEPGGGDATIQAGQGAER